MNQGVVHGSQMVAAGSPNWWRVTNMSTPPRHQHHSFLVAPPYNYFPHQLNEDDDGEFPESWSQLLLGSEQQVDEEVNKSSTGTKQMQAEKDMEQYYEEQLMNQIISSSSSCFADLKRDQNFENYGAGNPKPFDFWPHHLVPASSPKSCVTVLSPEMLDFSHKSSEWKINNPRDYSDPSSECNSRGRGGANKKARIQPTSSQTTFKVRKETLRDKITAIHQLVSPFGKTDTASVLLEAVGYIRFLQNQIEALSQPYLGSGSRNMRNQLSESDKKEANKDLRSRGLCLVPVSCTFHLGSDNAADYWAPSPFAANIR